jgi:3',5'-cyclic AMP phosphodiesterase CpdA
MTLLRQIKNRSLLIASHFSIALILLIAPLVARAQFPPFAIVGDTHVGYAGSAYETFIAAIDQQRINVIIHLGDAIDKAGNAAQWAEFQRITGTGKTLYLVPGNHDVDSDRSLATYLSLFGKSYYSVPEGDTLFVMLNTEIPGEQSMIAGEQLEWLVSELKRPFKYKFVFLHQPPFPVFAGHGLDKHRDARDRLHELFVRSGVALVVSGHDHLYNKTSKDGITYVIASGGGGKFYLPASNGAFLHYVVGTRTEKGYSFTVKAMDGEVRDRFVIGR